MRQVESGGVVNKPSPDAVISGASRGTDALAGQVATARVGVGRGA